MKNIFHLLIILTLLGCSPSRYFIAEPLIEEDAISIQQLTNSISNNPDYFLSKLTLDTNGLAHYKDSLGYNFSIETGGYKLNDRVYFWLSIIREGDSLFSLSASPFYWTIGGKWQGNYDKIYKSAGWTKIKYEFDDKYYNFQSTTKPINNYSLINSKYKNSIDSLMTPYFDYVYHFPDFNESNIDYLKFKHIANKFSNDELLYLLNSINPATRAYTIKYIKYNNFEYNENIKNKIEELLYKSPKVKTMFADIVDYSDLKKLIDCK
jgi:hypothetical protein